VTGEAPTVGQRAYLRIRDDVLQARLAPGAKLKLDQLRKTYGASTATLREILSRLVSEKLVVAEGQRGFEVAPVSAANLREIAALRLLVEREGLRLSLAQGDAAWAAGAEAAHQALARLEERALAGGTADAAPVLRHDWLFHRALIAACGSAALMAAHAAVSERYLRYQAVAVRAPDAATAREHQALLAAALARDAAEADALVVRHVRRGVEMALQSGLIR
jgi:DNA-binding GntR family transcriptional regulator